jgi:predicted kinase
MTANNRPVLLIVNGHPATGKTTLAREIASALSLPLFTKDDIKESLFDVLGGANVEASRALGRAAWELLYLSAETLLAADKSLVIEGNFYRESADPWVAAMEQRHGQLTVQVVLHTEPGELIRRYRERRGRHPAHLGAVRIPDVVAAAAHPLRPLEVNGPTINIDTTDFGKVDTESLIEHLQRIIERPST